MIGIWLWVAVCPPLEVMKQAAVTAYDVDGRTLAQMARSLRVRHVLPTLAVRAWHVDTVLDDVSTTSLHSGWGIEGRMELQLSQLVFDNREVDLQREKLRAAHLRLEILRSVQENYFEYLSVRAQHTPAAEQRLREVVETLNTLTADACKESAS